MNIPISTTFRDLDQSPAILAYIKNRTHKLSHAARRITDLHLFAEKHQKRDNGPVYYRVSITLNVPENQLAAHHEGCSNLYKAIHLAFNKLQRQLHDHGHIQNGMTKHHEAMSGGTIRRLFPHSDDRFGFIENQLGEEFYFNTSNLSSSDFDHLKEGDHVLFVPHLTDSGPQAHRIKRKKE